MRIRRLTLTMLLMAVLVAASEYGEAATPVTIALTGPATYSITTKDLPESSGMELSIRYDTNALEAPQIKSGVLTAGAMMDQNISIPGSVRIVFITSGVIKGTGELVRITFIKKTGAQAKLIDFAADVYSLAYERVPVNPVIEENTAGSVLSAPSGGDNPAITGNTTGTTTGTTAPGSAAGTTVPGYAGTISFSDTQQQSGQQVESKKQENRNDRQSEYRQQDSPAPAPAVEPTEAAPVASAADTSKKAVPLSSSLHSIQGILVRFREYKGPRVLKGFSTLFDTNEGKSAGIVQKPAIIVSDGKSLVTVTVDIPNELDAPVFSLKGANQKSIRRTSDNKWELVALPQKGKFDVRLSIILKGERIEIPLVVVPPLNHSETDLTDLSAAALDALLAKPLKNNKPAYDLNSDGKQDHLDDYILVARWLLKQHPSVNKNVKKPTAVGK